MAAPQETSSVVTRAPSLTPGTPQLSFYLVDASTDAKVDASTLMLYRVQIARLQFGTSIVGKLQFGADGQTNYVNWSVCPKTGSANCTGAQTSGNEIYIGLLDPGSYTVIVEPCVNAVRSLNEGKSCGPKQAVNWVQPAIKDDVTQDILRELLRSEDELRTIGQNLSSILRQYHQEKTLCPKSSDAAVQDALDTQLQNILNLGPQFVVQAVAGLRTDAQSQELASIITAPNTDPSEGGSTTYYPKGLSLVDDTDQRLKAFYAKTAIDADNGIPLSPRDVLPVVRANSGIFHNDQSLALDPSRINWNELSPQQRCGVLGGLASLQLQHLSSQEAQIYASYEALNSLICAITAPRLGLAGSTCQAETRAAQRISVIQDRVRDLKQRIGDLRISLSQAKAK